MCVSVFVAMLPLGVIDNNNIISNKAEKSYLLIRVSSKLLQSMRHVGQTLFKCADHVRLQHPISVKVYRR